MTRLFALGLFGIFLLPLFADDDGQPPKLPRNVLTNRGIVALADAGYDEDFLVDLIQARPTRFDVSADALVSLALHGLSERVVRAMLARPNGQSEAHPMATSAPPAQLAVLPARLVPAVRIAPTDSNRIDSPAAVAPVQVISKRTWLFHRKWYIVEPQPQNLPARYLPVW